MTIEDVNKMASEHEYLLLDFYGTWCMPCRMQSEIIEELQQSKVSGLYINKVDVDKNMDLCREYNIVSVPTLMLFKKGELVKRYVGVANIDTITSWIE